MTDCRWRQALTAIKTDDQTTDRLDEFPALGQRQPDPLAHRRRWIPDRRDRNRRHRDGRPFSRARAEQQRARTGKHRAVAGPPFRPAAAGFRRDPAGRRRLCAVHRHRNQRTLQAPHVQCGHSPDAQGQDRRILLCRQHQSVRCGRRDDQFLHRLAGAARQHRRPGFFQDLQVGPEIPLAAGRTGLQPRHRRLDHRACPQTDRT